VLARGKTVCCAARRFADHGLEHIRWKQREMNEAGEPVTLYAVHGHYADAGEAAAKMAHSLDVPMVLTGHSLGRNKLDHLLRSGTIKRDAIEETYKISRRIEAEERALDAALMVITSTRQEVEQQWGLYDGYDADLAAVLHRKGGLRKTSGRSMPIMAVIPPGLDFSALKVCVPV
jgi:sucrose-phosphate synthase